MFPDRWYQVWCERPRLHITSVTNVLPSLDGSSRAWRQGVRWVDLRNQIQYHRLPWGEGEGHIWCAYFQWQQLLLCQTDQRQNYAVLTNYAVLKRGLLYLDLSSTNIWHAWPYCKSKTKLFHTVLVLKYLWTWGHFSLIWCSVVYSCMIYGIITMLFVLGDFRHVLCWVYTKPTTSLMVISGPVSSSNTRKVARHRVKVNKLLLLLPPLPELPSSAPTRAFRARSRRQTRRDPRQVH